MAAEGQDIDLDSVIDRLLEGELAVRLSSGAVNRRSGAHARLSPAGAACSRTGQERLGDGWRGFAGLACRVNLTQPAKCVSVGLPAAPRDQCEQQRACWKAGRASSSVDVLERGAHPAVSRHSRIELLTAVNSASPLPPYAVRGNRPGKQVQLQEYEIKFLCTKAREIFINQPILLELEAPIKICGSLARVLFILALRHSLVLARR